LLVHIVNPDPDLREALASTRAKVNYMRDIYESAVAFMLPVKSHYVDRNVIKLQYLFANIQTLQEP